MRRGFAIFAGNPTVKAEWRLSRVRLFSEDRIGFGILLVPRTPYRTVKVGHIDTWNIND
jgi:hypothetical protein